MRIDSFLFKDILLKISMDLLKGFPFFNLLERPLMIITIRRFMELLSRDGEKLAELLTFIRGELLFLFLLLSSNFFWLGTPFLKALSSKYVHFRKHSNL